MKVKPVVLKGEFVRLEPMTLAHLPALCEAGIDGSLWNWTPTRVDSREDMLRYIETALGEQKRGVTLPFVTIENISNTIVGSTRFANIDTTHRHAEIGWTWINPQWQRTAINTEAKLLMLTHAFETWKYIRVELKTDVLNERSRQAILRIGAKQEGIFRNHLITETGRFRDSVYYSIIEAEWPEVRENLRARLEK